MTSERKKAVLFLSITLVIGILIGAMIPSFFGRMRHKVGIDRTKMEQRDNKKDAKKMDRKSGFERMVFRITKPDSDQVKLIRPILNETSLQIEALERKSNEEMSAVMDSMKAKLKPVLREDQMKKLEDFSQKARARRRR
ncbi:MAG: hypothetical protein HOP08_18205 [Cyclobacteriaceae bacterium]|nr:hypothetical protein [Cyclobacteriaceae bacterium]